MDFEWDPEKRQRNIDKHHIDFLDAQEVFEKPHIVVPSDRQGEKRSTATGRVREIIITVAYTERGQSIRIISARKARDHERERYQDLYE